MFSPRQFVCVVALLGLLLPGNVTAQIYADVQTAGDPRPTGDVNGTFTIELEHTKVPTTVASFIGLATGQRAWIDYATGAVRKDPFYNGVTFHRVIGGFMSQVGSRKGDGTDGPGYSFKDEFDPTLRHDGAYVVSMANSGKHTNGSQIFITASAQPSLNDKHSVFGRVIAGQALLNAINGTATGAGDVPSLPITIQSITVYGPSLAGFNLFPATLPSVVDARPVLTKAGSTFSLSYDARTFSAYNGYRGSDLAAWSLFKNTYSPATAPTGVEDVTSLATGTRHYFRMSRIDYGTTAARFTPPSLASRTFTFTSNFPYPIVVAVNAAGTGGTWQMPGLDSGTLNTVLYGPGRFTSQMRFIFNPGTVVTGSVNILATVDYTSANGGPFTATTNFTSYPNLTGTFTTLP